MKISITPKYIILFQIVLAIITKSQSSSNSSGSQVIYPSASVDIKPELNNIKNTIISIKPRGKSLLSEEEINFTEFFKLYFILLKYITAKIKKTESISILVDESIPNMNTSSTSKVLFGILGILKIFWKEKFAYVIKKGGQIRNEEFVTVRDAFIKQQKNNIDNTIEKIKKPVFRRRAIVELAQKNIRRKRKLVEIGYSVIEKILSFIRHILVKYLYIEPTKIINFIYKLFSPRIAKFLVKPFVAVNKHFYAIGHMFFIYLFFLIILFGLFYLIRKIIKIVQTVRTIYCVKKKGDVCTDTIHATKVIIKGLINSLLNQVKKKNLFLKFQNYVDHIAYFIVRIIRLLECSFGMIMFFFINLLFDLCYLVGDAARGIIEICTECFHIDFEQFIKNKYIQYLIKIGKKIIENSAPIVLVSLYVLSIGTYFVLFFMGIIFFLKIFYFTKWTLKEFYTSFVLLVKEALLLMKLIVNQTSLTFKRNIEGYRIRNKKSLEKKIEQLNDLKKKKIFYESKKEELDFSI